MLDFGCLGVNLNALSNRGVLLAVEVTAACKAENAVLTWQLLEAPNTEISASSFHLLLTYMPFTNAIRARRNQKYGKRAV